MPVGRKRRRYLRLWVCGDREFSSTEVWEAIRKGALDLYGVEGLSLMEPVLIEFDEGEQRGILRCNRSCIRKMRAVLAFIVNIRESAAAIHVERASGTLKSLRSN
jgi:RNase P/RNase MRP subunit POP5